MTRFRVATYNIHKCRGLDRKTSPERIVAVIKDLDADVLCLQEVVNAPGGSRLFDQAREISAALPGYAWCFGSNRPLHGGEYGNMTLSRLPLLGWRNYNLTHRRREERGVLRADVDVGGGTVVHFFNVHLGTGFAERRAQAERLVGSEVLGHTELVNPRLVVGDFNEWTRGLTTRLLEKSFKTFRPQHGMGFPRTFPGMLPLLSLDFYYYEPPLQLLEARLFRSRQALVASDHLPLVAEFEIG